MDMNQFGTASSESDDFLDQLEALMKNEFFSHKLLIGEAQKLDPNRKYDYEPITTADSIRVLYLEPGNENDPLKGSMKIVPLDKTDFEALSYAWGSWEKPHNITLSEGTVPITKSLDQALRRLRQHRKTRCLWVDAICIDQINNEEKSTQIVLMPRIYSEARRAVVYLGEDDGNGSVALDFFEKVGHVNFSSLKNMSITPEWIHQQNLPPQGDALWYKLLDFWRRPWFRRTWVVQEFIMARDVLMVCGSRNVNWKKLTSAMEKMLEYTLMDWGLFLELDAQKEKDEGWAGSMCMRLMFDLKNSTRMGPLLANTVRSFSERDETGLPEMYEGSWNNIPFVKELVMLLREQPEMAHGMTDILEKTIESSLSLAGASQDGVKLQLVNLLPMFEYSEVSVPRDRLFALLGLAQDGADNDLRPSYDEPTEEVLLRYAKTFIKNGQGLDVLYAAGISGRDADIPSWVPDWSQPQGSKSRPLSLNAKTGKTYRAAADIESNFQFGNSPQELVTQGSYLDKISRLLWLPLPDIDGKEGDLLYLARLRKFFVEVDGFASSGNRYVTGEPLVEVQWRTLVGNLSVRPRIAPREYGDEYAAFRKNIEESNKEEDLVNIFYNSTEFVKRLLTINQMYAVCETTTGFIGMVPKGTLVGDSVYLIAGATMPFVMRTHPAQEESLQIVGPCYVHGVMNGEGIRSAWVAEDIHIM